MSSVDVGDEGLDGGLLQLFISKQEKPSSAKLYTKKTKQLY